MQVLFESRDPEGARLRELTVRRVRFIMRRLVWLVPTAKVQLSDSNGLRGGIDKRCTVELHTHGSGTLVASSSARDWRSAVEAALTRAARMLLRVWRRGHPPVASRRGAREFRR